MLWKKVEAEQAKSKKKSAAAAPARAGLMKRKASEPEMDREERAKAEKEEKKKPLFGSRGVFKKTKTVADEKEEVAAEEVSVAAKGVAAAAVAATRSEFGTAAKRENCLICFEDGVNTVVLCCMNSFHVHCLAQWLEKGNANCPSCRAAIHWQLERKKIVLPQVPWLNLNAVARYFPSSDEDDDDGGGNDDNGFHYCQDCGEYHA